jgi:phage tail-like protein
MARHRLADFMQNHRFWLLDVVPSATFPYLVLGAPLLGFSSITAPEYTADVDEIKEVNSMFKKHGYSGGSVSPITLTRGVLGYDDTFYQWMMRAIRGNDMTGRNLLLLHFTSIGHADDDIGIGAWEAAAFLPGKAWILWECIPTRYKAGSDFDAMDGAVSIAELDVQPRAMTELTLLSPL